MEYKIVEGGGEELQAQMNKLASDGWHFCAVVGLDVVMERKKAHVG